MNQLYYLLEANLYLLCFYAVYLLLFNRLTHHQINRAYLLSTSLLAFVIPLVQVGWLKIAPVAVPQITAELQMGASYALAPPIPRVAVVNHISWQQLLPAAYWLVTALMSLKLAIKIYRVFRLAKKGIIKKSEAFTIVQIPIKNTAFSFFKYLFIDDELSALTTIIAHEQVHIRQKHSVDIVLLELLKAINWFNPVVYFIQKSLKDSHEFIADQATARLENDTEAYANFLIRHAYHINQSSLTNSFFNKNQLKTRITMLYQQQSGSAARLRYLLILPLLGGMLCLSTMAFTNKAYGFIDVASTKAIAARIIAATIKPTTTTAKAIDATKQVMAEKQVVKTPKTDSATKQPLIIVDGKVMITPASFNIKTATDKDYLRYLGIKTGDIKAIQVMKEPTVNGIYGEAGANGVIIFTTKSASITKSVSAADSLANNKVFTAVEVSPVFNGGQAGFSMFLAHNIKYPKTARDSNIQGRVYATFIVEKDGSLSNIKIMRSPSKSLSDETIRVLSLSPNWTPGYQNNQPVRVSFTVPVNFSLGASPTQTIVTIPELQKHLEATIKYPESAKANKLVGAVGFKFIVNDDQSIGTPIITRSTNLDMNAEFLRSFASFKASDKISPGQYLGMVDFNLQGNGEAFIKTFLYIEKK